ncbi:hypothetical protein PybrP1_009530 [[Pythium] brassicae (nom. inval.)]|nr:hypothetical protein PybrP1_009530 [[Pythium] brassicae (nom. inval.)]
MSSNDGGDSDSAAAPAAAAPKKQKLHDGYHGWMRTIPKTEQDFTPVRIAASEHAAVPTAAGNSAWNAAGTWEERDRSAWARERLKLLVLTDFRFEDAALGVAVAATSISRCEGDAKVIFSRGKKRCGYDIALKFAWSAKRSAETEDAEDEVTGHVEIRDFDDTSGEEYEVTVSADVSHSRGVDVRNAVLKREPELRKLLAAWKEELLLQ